MTHSKTRMNKMFIIKFNKIQILVTKIHVINGIFTDKNGKIRKTFKIKNGFKDLK